jgi:transcription-repair coupling factor (superfamily II helicase)
MFQRIEQDAKIRAIEAGFREGHSLLLEGLWNSPKACVAALAAKSTGKHLLILTGASLEEVRLFEDFKLFTERPVVDFPAWETLPAENIPPSPDIVGERYQVLAQIHQAKEPYLLISSLQACLQKLLPPEKFEALHFSCRVGERVSFQGLIERLDKSGYERKNVACDKGEYAVRGSIIDLFPVSSPDPYRLEFWGDELESMRLYDPIGQGSIKPVQQLDLLPGQELELIQKEGRLSSILDYLGPNTLIVLDDLLSLEDRYAQLMEIRGSGPHFFSIEEFLDRIKSYQTLYLSAQPIEELSEVLVKSPSANYYSKNAGVHEVSFEMFGRKMTAARVASPFMSCADLLQPDPETDEVISLPTLGVLATKGWEVHLLCESEAEKERVIAQVPHGGKIDYRLGYLSSGFALEESQFLLFPMTELTGRFKIRRQKQRSTYHTTQAEVNDLVPGDLVVHFQHGIGKFLGLEKRPNHLGVLSEFFLIEYAEGGKLYVPMQQAYLVSKYIGAHEETPRLHTIGSARWKKVRDQTQTALLGYATELLDLYARRELKGGFTFQQDSEEMRSFEEEFPYVETEDQLNAIASLKEDMTSPKAMDRLVCGDVGYGKTEVAMRAAFKAVVDGGKQVSVLVPTTVLAMQHYENFVDRMRNFPVRIGVLSRFRSPKEIRETLEGVAKGTIDIVIGTHRIISKDVKFKDLGLVIIDEEQRFGVKAKEHLKKIKTGVDCLTLSATPIPRTLYMSLVGVRDMSVISSPPQDRLPIKTILAEPDPQAIKNALLRELSRDGQAYFIHNRVETINDAASKLKEMLPQAKIVVGHGQMDSDELDLVFHAFKSGAANILVATSIVENGIDIPNANTILIDRADRFGLSDLYQMRGRVGRWNRRAYAYFLVPSLKSLPELSRKRLNALVEASGYGGGMKLAMRDLEIRGAGDLLGLEQSGHVATVGFHLYCKMLKRTIKTLQGKQPLSLTDVKIDVPFDARLTEEYMNDMSLRLEFYQRFGEALTLEEVDALYAEMVDRYGKPPLQAEWLYRLTRLKVFAQLNHISEIKADKYALKIERLRGSKKEEKSFLLPLIKHPIEVDEKWLPLLKK